MGTPHDPRFSPSPFPWCCRHPDHFSRYTASLDTNDELVHADVVVCLSCNSQWELGEYQRMIAEWYEWNETEAHYFEYGHAELYGRLPIATATATAEQQHNYDFDGDSIEWWSWYLQ
jgi:hypothetical protein